MSLNRSLVNLYKQKATEDNNIKRMKPHGQNQIKRAKTNGSITSETNLESSIKFEDLYGINNSCEHVKKIVDSFKKGCQRFDQVAFICGSSGLGKTAIVQAASNYGGLDLFRIPMEEILEKPKAQLKDELEMLVRNAVTRQPCILLIDDINMLETSQDFQNSLLLTNLLRRTLKVAEKLLVFCTSSNLKDQQLLGSLVFRIIRLQRPNHNARFNILKRYDLPFELKDVQQLASKTPSFTANDLKTLIFDATNETQGQLNIEQCLLAASRLQHRKGFGSHLVEERPNVRWEDIGGIGSLKKQFESILRNFKCPDEDEDGRFSGIVLHGPPGCGKTMIAKAMANEAEMNFIAIKAAELFDKYLGETERNIRKVFEDSYEYEPCIIYFDEFDALCGTRGVRESGARAIETLLTEMDGFSQRGTSLVLASTNRLTDIDPAMRRPGRLSRSIYVGAPNRSARLDILKKISTDKLWKFDQDVDLEKLSTLTREFTGAELKFLIVSAKSKAIDVQNDGEALVVRWKQINEAVADIKKMKVININNKSDVEKKNDKKHKQRKKRLKRVEIAI